jgi:hypothetical protein
MLVLVAATLGDAAATPLVAQNVNPAGWKFLIKSYSATNFTSTILDAPRTPSVSFSGKRDVGSQLH